ncbi:hypothetical protein SNE40_003912 [Patella caerulea]|uniref:Chitin-binding type-2 domain-containing protein n=1 Tax=Patella caerulea TaxID=87958 RepID=A0AAN8KAT4_PATCE
MLRYVILFVCVFAVLAQFKRGKPRRKSEKPKWNCTDIEDGLYIGDCLNFYRCQNETTRHLPCPGDLVVNEKQMWCDYKDLVAPPCGTAPNCTGIIDGNYPDYSRRCQYYYTCLHNDFYGFTKCAANLLYNPEKNNCDWAFLVKPPCGGAAEHVYPEKPDRVG